MMDSRYRPMEPETQNQLQPPPVVDPVRWDAFLMLGAVFLVMIALALVNTFGSKGSREGASDTTTGVEVRSLLLQEALGEYMTALSPLQAATQKRSLDKSYDKVIEDVGAKKGKNNPRLLTSLHIAAGRKPPADALEQARSAAKPPASDAIELATGSAEPRLVESVAAWRANDPTDKLLRMGALRAAKQSQKIGPLVAPEALLGFGAVLAVGGLELALGVVVLLVLAANWAKFKASIRGFACGPLDNRTAGELAVRTVVFICLFMFGSVPFAVFRQLNDLPNGGSMLLHGGTSLVAALLAAAVPFGGRGGLARIWGKVSLPVGLLTGLGGLCANAPVLMLSLPFVALLSKVLPDPVHPINTVLAKGAGFGETLAIFVVGSVFAPVAEETVFRGMLFPALSKVTGSVLWGGLLQGFLFAAIHPQGPAGWPPIMAIGCVSAFITYRSGALWPSVLMHGIHNGVILMLNVTMSAL